MKDSLVNMDISDNPVFTRGETFNTWLGQLTNLEILRYEDTNFINSNGIPTEIGFLKKLGFYECSNVRYIGAIDSSAFPSDMTQLCKYPLLRQHASSIPSQTAHILLLLFIAYIEMEFNTFNSPIPTEIGLLPNLQFFYARGSSITGDLEFMRNMAKIRTCKNMS
jgi:hypothetical protein